MLLVLLAASPMVLTIAPAFGQGLRQVQTRGLGAACLPDYMRLCRGVPPGGGRIILCLNTRAEDLSQECFQALARRGLEFAAALKACRPDFERLCPNVPPGLGRGAACLAQNAAALSPPCREALSRHDVLDDPPEPRRGLR